MLLIMQWSYSSCFGHKFPRTSSFSLSLRMIFVYFRFIFHKHSNLSPSKCWKSNSSKYYGRFFHWYESMTSYSKIKSHNILPSPMKQVFSRFWNFNLCNYMTSTIWRPLWFYIVCRNVNFIFCSSVLLVESYCKVLVPSRKTWYSAKYQVLLGAFLEPYEVIGKEWQEFWCFHL